MNMLFPDHDCFLDMDGVLFDMHSACLKAYDRMDLLKEGKWPDSTNDIAIAVGVTRERLWNKIKDTQEWWSSLELYPWSFDLVRFLMQHFRSLRILTHPQDREGSYLGKFIAIHKHFGYSHPKIIFCEDKYLLGCSDRVLIDDTPFVVEAWRKAGGVGIVFPRPWNTRSSMKDIPMIGLAGCLMLAAEKAKKRQLTEDFREPWEIFPKFPVETEKLESEINVEEFMKP